VRPKHKGLRGCGDLLGDVQIICSERVHIPQEASAYSRTNISTMSVGHDSRQEFYLKPLRNLTVTSKQVQP
jgi:hypothetical protein